MPPHNQSGVRGPFKVVVVGPPGVGKGHLIEQAAQQDPPTTVRRSALGGATVFRCSRSWETGKGTSLFRLVAVSGQPLYEAVGDLLLTGANAVLYLASLAVSDAIPARNAFHALLRSAARLGLDLTALPVAFCYLAAREGAAGTPEQLDAWLGVSPGSVRRFAPPSGSKELALAALDWVVAELGGGSEDRAASTGTR